MLGNPNGIDETKGSCGKFPHCKVNDIFTAFDKEVTQEVIFNIFIDGENFIQV